MKTFSNRIELGLAQISNPRPRHIQKFILGQWATAKIATSVDHWVRGDDHY